MTNNSSPLVLLQEIVSHLGFAPTQAHPMSQKDLVDAAFLRGRITPDGLAGIRRGAGNALYHLAEALFEASPAFVRGTTFSALYDALGDAIIGEFLARKSTPLVDPDLVLVQAKVEQWFQKNSATFELYVPCVLPPRPAPDFAVGPVEFSFIEEFARRQAVGDPLFEPTFGIALGAMSNADAPWVATVSISGCTKARAWDLGEIAVDLALTGIQLAIPQDDSRYMARMYGRTTPRHRVDMARDRTRGEILSGSAKQLPGMSMGPGMFEHLLVQGAPVLRAVGPRISAFLGHSCNFPTLEQAWADSAYWFHEGLAEPIDTIAVTKLETAIEVLMRAESSKGSTARIIQAIEAFFGFSRNQPFGPSTQATVADFAQGFVRDRSRILHGTWSTLGRSMRLSRANLTNLAGSLLANYVVALDEYSALPGGQDDLESFLVFIRKFTPVRASSAPAATP